MQHRSYGKTMFSEVVLRGHAPATLKRDFSTPSAPRRAEGTERSSLQQRWSRGRWSRGRPWLLFLHTFLSELLCARWGYSLCTGGPSPLER